MTDAREQLGGALAQLRIGYRLVVAYQRRLLDLARRFEAGVRARHPDLNFERWAPTDWSMPPSGTTNPMPRWAWDFVPLYRCEFRWLTGATPAPGAFWLWLTHYADTGWPAVSKTENDPLGFAEAAGCDTIVWPGVLAIPLGGSVSAPPPSWDALYLSLNSKDEDWMDRVAHERDVDGCTVRWGGFTCSVSELAEPSDVEKNLIEPTLQLLDLAVGRPTGTSPAP